MKEKRKNITVKGSEIEIIVFFDEKMDNSQILRLAREARIMMMDMRSLKVPTRSPFYSNNPNEIKGAIDEKLFHLIKISLKKHMEIENAGDFTIKISITNRLPPHNQVRYAPQYSDALSAFIYVNFKELVKNLLCYKVYAGEIVRSFSHELTHFFDPETTKCRLKLLAALDRSEKRDMLGPALLYLMAVQDLRLEGLSNFSVSKRIRKVRVDVPDIFVFNKVIDFAVEQPTWDEAFEFYKHEVRNRIQYVAFLMSYFIGYSLLDDWKVHKMVVNGRITTLTELNDVMGRHRRFWIERLPDHVFDRTYSEIKKTNYRQFIKLYEKACNKLNIPEEYRVISWNQFKHGLKKAHNLSKKHEQLVETAGFR